jgi:hypothetical protein
MILRRGRSRIAAFFASGELTFGLGEALVVAACATAVSVAGAILLA